MGFFLNFPSFIDREFNKNYDSIIEATNAEIFETTRVYSDTSKGDEYIEKLERFLFF